MKTENGKLKGFAETYVGNHKVVILSVAKNLNNCGNGEPYSARDDKAMFRMNKNVRIV